MTKFTEFLLDALTGRPAKGFTRLSSPESIKLR